MQTLLKVYQVSKLFPNFKDISPIGQPMALEEAEFLKEFLNTNSATEQKHFVYANCMSLRHESKPFVCHTVNVYDNCAGGIGIITNDLEKGTIQVKLAPSGYCDLNLIAEGNRDVTTDGILVRLSTSQMTRIGNTYQEFWSHSSQKSESNDKIKFFLEVPFWQYN